MPRGRRAAGQAAGQAAEASSAGKRLRVPRANGGGRSRALGAAVLLGVACSCLWSSGVAQPSGSGSALTFVSVEIAKQAVPPFCGLALGFGLHFFGGGSKGAETAAIVLIYFGAQTGMNLYMKSVLSKIVVDEEEGLKGVPIGFLLTAIQQMVAFAMFCGFLIVGKLAGRGYQVKQLSSAKEYLAVLCFSMAFALNIGLNNFSLSLVAISINMIMRSCLPLSTALSQIVVGTALGRGQKHIPALEWAFMLGGVGCAGLATYAKSMSGSSSDESAALTLGVMVLVASLFAGALNMVLAGLLGSEMKLNPLDATCYMALPAGIVLLVPSLLVSHPMEKWPGFPHMTDWEVLLAVMERKPAALLPVVFSGVLSFFYNILQYTMVHKLSASYATFTGNFNKAATVALSLILGLEALPAGGYGHLFLLGVIGNIAAFTMYSIHKTGAK